MDSKRNIADWQLERYLLGELPPALSDRIRIQLEHDGELKKRLTALKKSNRQILSDYPPEIMIERIEKRYREKYSHKKMPASVSRARRMRNVGFAVATAVLLLVILLPLRHMIVERVGNESEEGIRVKGLKPHLIVYRKEGGGTVQLKGGEQVREHDVLQLRYVAGDKKYGVIFSVDGRGVVTLHYPESSMETSPELDPDGEVSLPYAYELDDAPLFERFFFLTSNKPFDTSEVEHVLHRLAANPDDARKNDLLLPGKLQQYSILLYKEEH